MAIKKTQRGFALLIAVIFMSVVLSFGLALGSLGYKQQVLASSAIESQYAFYAADAALECALYADQQQALFNPPGNMPLTCGGQSFPVTSTNSTINGIPYLVSSAPNISLDDNTHCADITVYKPETSPATTYVFSQGYNVSCSTVTSSNGARFASRGLSYHY